MTKAEIKAAEVLANRKLAFAKKVRSLTGHAVPSANAILFAFEQGLTADAFAAQVAAQEPVGKAVWGAKSEAVAFAVEHAQKTIDHVADELAAHGWDINAAAPYPSRGQPHYDRAKNKHQLFQSLTTSDPALCYQGGRPGEPRYVVLAVDNPRWGVEKFLNDTREATAAAYDAFICKLVAKVGAGVLCASLEGSHVWGYSILTVTKLDGTVERWKTQQITNYTQYGTPYLQWPTRKVK